MKLLFVVIVLVSFNARAEHTDTAVDAGAREGSQTAAPSPYGRAGNCDIGRGSEKAPLPTATPAAKQRPPGNDGIRCVSPESKYVVILDFWDGTAAVYDGKETLQEVGACVLTSGATNTVRCTQGGNIQQSLNFFGDKLQNVAVSQGTIAVANLKCENWKRTPPETTCASFFTGFYINPLTKKCAQAQTSGCSNPFAYTTSELCQTALRASNGNIPLGK